MDNITSFPLDPSPYRASTNQYTEFQAQINERITSWHKPQSMNHDVKACHDVQSLHGYHLYLSPTHNPKGLCEFTVDIINGQTGNIVRFQPEHNLIQGLKEYWSQQFDLIKNTPCINRFNNAVYCKKRFKEPENIFLKLNQELNLTYRDDQKIKELYKQQKGNNKLIRLIDAVAKSNLISPKAFIEVVFKAGYEAFRAFFPSEFLEIPPMQPMHSTDKQRANGQQSLCSISISEQSLQWDNQKLKTLNPCQVKKHRDMPPTRNHHATSRSARFNIDTQLPALAQRFKDWNTQQQKPPGQQESWPSVRSDDLEIQSSTGSSLSLIVNSLSPNSFPPEPDAPTLVPSEPHHSQPALSEETRLNLSLAADNAGDMLSQQMERKLEDLLIF